MSSESGSLPNHALQVRGDKVVLGEWEGDLNALIATSLELRQKLREGRPAEARALVQARPAEEQAALVAMDECPEEVLSLTAMDERGRPGYSPAVVDKLPADIVAEVLVPRNARLLRFNTEVLKTISPEAFERVVDETLDPVHYHGYRSKLSWEWLEAVAALDDPARMAELLYKVDPSLLEDAFMERVHLLGLEEIVSELPAFRFYSESGGGLMLPPVGDAETDEIVQALHRAAPELLARVVRNAWERREGFDP